MKERFKEYHISEHLDQIFKEAIIVLDTNSLLNLYRYSEDNRNKYFEILKKVKSRLHLTHHVCEEFYKNRLTIIENRSTFKETIVALVEEHQTKLLNIIKNASGSDEKYNSALSILKHEVELKDQIITEIETSSGNIKGSIEKFTQDFDIGYDSKDPILDEIVNLFENKISLEIVDEQKDKIYSDGEKRYKKLVPPGYRDNAKDSPEKFGDLIIWNELQVLAKEQKKNILFISDDRKEDWVTKFKGKDLGPRKELIKEFLKNTGFLFYSLTTRRFVELISESYSISDTESLKEETEIIQENYSWFEKEISPFDNYPFEKYNRSHETLERLMYPERYISEKQAALDRLMYPEKYLSERQAAIDRLMYPDKPMSSKSAVETMMDSINQFNQRSSLYEMLNRNKYLEKQKSLENMISDITQGDQLNVEKVKKVKKLSKEDLAKRKK